MALKDIAVFAGILIVWFGLMRFLLPALGIPTCMSGACQIGPSEACPLAGNPSADDQAGDGQPEVLVEEPGQSDSGAIGKQP